MALGRTLNAKARKALIDKAKAIEKDATFLDSQLIRKAQGNTKSKDILVYGHHAIFFEVGGEMKGSFGKILNTWGGAAKLRLRAGDYEGAYLAYKEGMRMFESLQIGSWLRPSPAEQKRFDYFISTQKRLRQLVIHSKKPVQRLMRVAKKKVLPLKLRIKLNKRK